MSDYTQKTLDRLIRENVTLNGLLTERDTELSRLRPEATDLRAEVARLRALIDGLECARPVTSNRDLRNEDTNKMGRWEYGCIEYAELTGNPREWCNVCKAKQAAAQTLDALD